MRVATRRCMIAARPGERAKDERGDGVGQVRASGDGDGRVDRARSTASQQAAPGAPELRGLLLPLPDALCARPRRAVLHVPTEQRRRSRPAAPAGAAAAPPTRRPGREPGLRNGAGPVHRHAPILRIGCIPEPSPDDTAAPGCARGRRIPGPVGGLHRASVRPLRLSRARVNRDDAHHGARQVALVAGCRRGL